MNDNGQSLKRLMFVVVIGLMTGIAGPAVAKPLKVFILAGQSNMQGHVNISTFDSLADDPKTAPILKEMRNADGKPRVCDKVWISSIGCAGDDTTEQKGKLTVGFGASTDEIGPEFTFGIYIEKLLDEPILIIKTSWGGKDLHTDFRPPSAGPFVWSDFEFNARKRRGDDMKKDKADKIKATGVYYRLMIKHVRNVLADIKRVDPEYDPKQGYELAGFVWFQGFNDLVSTWTYDKCNQPGGYDMYGQLLAQFIRDVRRDLSAPKMPFVIGIMGIGGVKEEKKPGEQKYFRQAQTAPTLLPEFTGNVVAVPTAFYWDDDLEALRARLEANWSKVDARVAEEVKKHPKMTREEISAYKMKLTDENFTPAERKRLKGASNGGYHYLGAAKIMAPIGKAFAEAMEEVVLAETEFAPKQDALPVAPPKGAIALFDGQGKNLFLNKEGKPTDWKVKQGELIATANGHHSNHAMSQLLFRDADVHVEFNTASKEHGNSGIYLHGHYEMQIYDSFGKENPDEHDEGALYGFQKPLVNAARKLGEWQVYDIRFRSPRRGADGKIVELGEISAWLNGHQVLDKAKFGEPRSAFHPFKYETTPYLTTIAELQKKTDVGPLFLQDHGSPCRFRNIWVVPLDDRAFLYEPK